MKKEWEKQIDSLLEAYHPEMIEKLRELIQFTDQRRKTRHLESGPGRPLILL